MRTIIVATLATCGFMATGNTASAHYCPHPACNYSAYYYQSPGGIGRAKYRKAAAKPVRRCDGSRLRSGHHRVR